LTVIAVSFPMTGATGRIIIKTDAGSDVRTRGCNPQ
jgi:hypothetical protein